MVVLDTTFLIALERGDGAAHRLYDEFTSAGQAIRVPAAVWVEYLSAMDAPHRRKARAMLDGAAIFEAFDREVAEEALELQHELTTAGRRLGWHDVQVAATARLKREPLVTNDRGLADLPGIETLAHGSGPA